MDTLKSRTKEMVLTKQQRIAENAKNLPDVSFCALAHHIDMNWLYQAFAKTRKDGAVGIDDVSAEDYEKNLGKNLKELLDKFKSGRYHAPAVKRVYIPKAGSKEKRPIGIPTYEDKVLQRAVQMVLEPIYEREFYNFSYGFRPGKSAHHAVEALWKSMMAIGGGWVIDLDISKFFDTLDHGKLREILKQRVCDGVITKAIDKWLNAGVMEGGGVSYSEMGTPQGGVISPILSNIYLHEVLDRWFVETVRPRLKGQASLIRYADDAVIVCKLEEDAKRIMRVLPKRFEKHGLRIHPEKTKLVDFRLPKDGERKGKGTFTFLGFKHFWMKSRKNKWVVGRKTDGKRFARALKALTIWCRMNRHEPVKEQHKSLSLKLNGHFGYYGITFNYRALRRFFRCAQRIWLKWLSRRSDKSNITWDRFKDFLASKPLPFPRVVHSYVA
jgi:RNA-directed DNA polymerase